MHTESSLSPDNKPHEVPDFKILNAVGSEDLALEAGCSDIASCCNAICNCFSFGCWLS